MNKIGNLPATYWLLGIIAAVFVIQLACAVSGIPFTETLYLDPAAVMQGGMLWGLVTSVFLHADPSHIFFNAFALFTFGIFLEGIVGAKNLLKVFFISGIIASVFYVLTSVFILGSYTPSLGASGAIFGVIGAVVALRPRKKVLFFFMMPMELWIAAIAFVFIAVAWLGTGGPTGVAENAHLGGLAAGFVIGLYFRRMEKSDKDFTWDRVYKTNDHYAWIDEYK